MRYYFIPTKMAIILKTKTNNSGKDRETGALRYWWEYKMVGHFKKIKIKDDSSLNGWACGPAIPLLANRRENIVWGKMLYRNKTVGIYKP